MNGQLPYLLFGPAGTGKTKTLVSAIEEIVRSSEKCVLVCANSNAACDEIANRLLRVLKVIEILRVYAKSYNISKVPIAIKECCNFINGEFQYPSFRYIYGFRVVVITLSSSGQYMLARSDPDFNADHFAYVFVDECASTNEITTMIPIAGMFFQTFPHFFTDSNSNSCYFVIILQSFFNPNRTVFH